MDETQKYEPRKGVVPATADVESDSTDVVPAQTDVVMLDSGGDSWDAMVPYMESFLEAWENGEGEPSIAEHLPDEPAVLRRLTLVELLKIDLEFRYRGDRDKRRLEDYLNEFEELRNQDGPPADLIYEEYHLRRDSGESVTGEQYLSRYPKRAAELGQLLAIESPEATTSLLKRSHVDVQPGERLGDFELVLILGKGAFGSVFLARQVSMQRLVALKVSSDHGSEPQTLAQLDHPYIVRVFDQHDLPERKLRLMYLQYVAGGALDAVLKRAKAIPAQHRNGRIVIGALEEQFERTGGIVQLDESTRNRLRELSWPELVCRWGAQLAEALDYAHSHGVLHRDVKPANVLLAADGSPKLADFNVSYASEVEGVTAGAFFGGSLAYMSPEQLEAFDPRHGRLPDELDGRADIYSLAVLLWELLFGERPFPNERMFESLSDTLDGLQSSRAIRVDDSRDPSDGELTQRLRVILSRAMAPNRDQRPASGAALAQELWLSLQPRAAKLLEKPLKGMRRWCARHAVLTVALATLIPNMLAGAFNLAYNWRMIVTHIPGADDVFLRVQTVINLTAFPLGIGLVMWYMWSMARRLRAVVDGGGDLEKQASAEGSAASESRIRALRLGRFVAWVDVGLWGVAGVVYPIALNMLTTGMNATDYVHFFVSLVYCGLIAAVIPYLLVCFLAFRIFCPAQYERLGIDEREHREMNLAGRRAGWFLLVAGALPALGLFALVITSISMDRQSVMAQLVLSIAGVVGFALAFYLYRVIQQDLAALTGALETSDKQ